MTFAPRTIRPLPNGWPPTLTVVIDTEEEFDWNKPFDAQATEVENIQRQPLAQRIFDRHGVVPTYVIDYPVARSPQACAVLKAIRDEGRCEIGAHLHPWVSPPHEGPIDERNSFPGNLSPRLERQKLSALTKAISEAFGARPTIYKAGRYGIGPATDGILAQLGYQIDVSVVPYTDFSARFGPDFGDFTNEPFVSAEGVLALPLSVGFAGRLAKRGSRLHPALCRPGAMRLRLPGVFSRLGLVERLRLTPEGHSLDDMIRLTRALLSQGQRLFMLTYHSSSLLPGGAPYVRSEADRTEFLATLDRYLAFFLEECGGKSATVSAVGAALLEGRTPLTPIPGDGL